MGALQQIPGRNGNTVVKRILTIDASEMSATGTMFQNTPEFEIVGENTCAIIGDIPVGSEVQVKFVPTGRTYIGKDGIQRVYTYNKALSAMVVQPQAQPQQVAQPQQIQQVQPQPQSYAAQPYSSPQQATYAQPQPQPYYAPPQPSANPYRQADENLPF